MIPEHRIATHPGEVLSEDFLVPLGLKAGELAGHIDLTIDRLSAVLAGTEPVDADIAWRLSMAFDTTPEFWLNLQAAHDLTRTRPQKRLARIAG